MDLGGLSTETIAAAAQYLAEKAAGAAANAAGSRLFEWLKSKLIKPPEQEFLDKLKANPSSQGAIRSLDGALLSHLEAHPDHVVELRRILADFPAVRSTQTVVGSDNTAVQAGAGNTINISRTN